jgi:hypothetical protein
MSSSGQYQVAATYTANLLYNYQFNLTDIQAAKLLNFATGQYDAALVNGALISSVNPKVGTGLLSLTAASSQYVSLPSFTMTAGYTGLTIAGWINLSATNGVYARFFDMSGALKNGGGLIAGSGTAYSYVIGSINSTTFSFDANASTSSSTSTTGIYRTPITQNGSTWSHIAWVQTSTTWTIYVNGSVITPTIVQAVTAGNYLPPTSYNSGVYPYVFLGRSSWSTDPYTTGSIDDFRLYTTALNASQVAALYNSNNGIVGTVQYSTNFGATWSSTSSIGTNTIQANYQALTMASTGQQVTGCLNTGTMFQSVTAQPNMATSGNMTVQGNTTTALTTYLDGTANVTAGLNLDYTTFGQSWTVVPGLSTSGNWVGMCISATGQYQSITNQGNYIWYSSNYGQSWTSVTSTGTANFYAICMSASGQYQTATVNQSGSIYISSNYGVTWTLVPNTAASNWQAINMSASGQYQSTATHTGGTLLGIWYSNNYGQTWTQSQTSGLTTRNWYFIGISASGQYQNACEPDGTIWYSTNYGQSWTQVNQVFAGARGICMSASGQYQSACTYNTGTSGTIWYSNNYGQTWTQSASILVYGLETICMSASGQYQCVVGFGTSGGLYYSTNYGATWTLSNAAASALFYSVCMSANGQYIAYGLNSSGAVYQSVTASPPMNISSGATASSTILNLLAPSMGNTSNLNIIFGRTLTTNNSFYMFYQNVGIGSTTNFWGLTSNGGGNTGLYLTSVGNVGIGMTNPSYVLDIFGANGAGSTKCIQLRNGGNETFVTSAQISPQIIFSYAGLSTSYPHWISSRHTSAGPAGNGLDFYISNGGNNSLANTNLIMTVAGNGVGIGTTNPSANMALDIVGNTRISGTLLLGHCAFLARAPSSWSTSTTPGNPIVYSNTIYNIGSCWNSGTYTFTAPVQGIYQFAGTFNTTAVGGAVYLEVTGTWGGTIYFTNHANGAHMPFTVQIQMGTGNTARLLASASSVYADSNDCISGCLLFRTG